MTYCYIRSSSGLDDIFARMNPSAAPKDGGRIDDDDGNGGLLGGMQDSLYGTGVKFKRTRR